MDKFMEKVTWKTSGHRRHDRGLAWYLVMAGIAVALILYALRDGSWSFAIAILVFLGVYHLIHHEEPKEFEVILSHDGITFDVSHIPFSNLNAFQIFEPAPFYRVLRLRPHSRLKPDFEIPLSDQDPEEIRQFLASYLRELPSADPSFSDALTYLLKL